MIAALPMYDWPELSDAWDAVWAAWRDAARRRGLDAPDELTRDRSSEEIWRDPNLLVAQTCGWPYVDRVWRWTRLVATPAFDAEGCDGPRYRSAMVMRQADADAIEDAVPAVGDVWRALAGRRIAVNSLDSLSGWRAAAPTLPTEMTRIDTGAHRASIEAVAEGRADVAAIDAVCWAYARDLDPKLRAGLRPIAWTPSLPALPFVTAMGRPASEAALLAEAFTEALADPSAAAARRRVRLRGAARLPADDYDEIRAVCAGTG